MRSPDLTRTYPAATPAQVKREDPILEPRWCLFLDVDGTLLELAATPDAVQVDDGLRGLLGRLNRSFQGAVALISGRTIAELDNLFGPHRWPAAGVHGLERRDAQGHWQLIAPYDTGAIDRARERLRQLADRIPGTLLEDKGVAIAVHYRRAPHAERELLRESRAIEQETGGALSLLKGRKVFELLPGSTTKADAIRAFLAEPPFAGRRPIFLGDDITDAGALEEVKRVGGLAIAVGDRVDAMMRLSGPRDVRVFLEELAKAGAPVQ